MLASNALGMSDEALSGWAKLHVKPRVIFLAYFAAIVSLFLSAALLYGVGLPWPTLIMHIPFLISASCILIMAPLIYKGGPLCSAQPPFLAASSVYTASTIFLLVASFVGPRKLVPFDSQLANVLGSACLMFCSFCAGAFGGATADHPPQPYTSLGPPLLNSAFTTLRFTDTMTDFGFVRILLYQGPDCQWFGDDVPCSRYALLAIIHGCVAALNLVLASAVSILGGQEMLFSSAGNMFKVAVSVNAAIAMAQLGTIAIAALKVLSDLQLPESAETPRLRREAAFAAISCVTTIGSFCINVLGMRRVLAAVTAAAASVRKTMQAAVRRSSAVAPAEAAGARDSAATHDPVPPLQEAHVAVPQPGACAAADS